MQKQLIVTITGPDRIGFVESITKLLLKHNANVVQSRMVRLGGDFAVLMLVTVPEPALQAAVQTIGALEAQGFQVITRGTTSDDKSTFAGWLPYRVSVNGADHEGIIHHIAHHLAERGINIETLTTGSIHAPMSGTQLFTMEAVVLAPPKLSLKALRSELESVGNSLSVDTEVMPYTG